MRGKMFTGSIAPPALEIKLFVTRLLTRDLFVEANLLVFVC